MGAARAHVVSEGVIRMEVKEPRSPRRIASRRVAGRADRGRSKRRRLALLAVGTSAVLAAVLGTCYQTMWRKMPVEVNGERLNVLVGTSVDDLLRANAYFDMRPGRLLSLSGVVLDERGGSRCVVRLDGKELPPDAYGQTRLSDNAAVQVGAGKDLTEGHRVEELGVAPGVTMRTGGAVQYVESWGEPGKKKVWKGTRSGEVLDKEVVAPAQDMVIASRNVHPKNGSFMALTFDDGPSVYTPKILDILKEKGVRATFYNLGESEKAFASYAKRLVDEGHELASHTNAHQYLPKLGKDALRQEITSAADALEQASGFRPQMIRAPYGAFDAQSWHRSADLISCNVLWNIDTNDWRRPGADVIANTVLKGAHNGAIVLMHDGGGDRSQDVEALPRIIDGLRSQGYELVTVSELMEKDGEFPQSVVSGNVRAPEGVVLGD